MLVNSMSETIGQQLKRAREARNLTITQVSHATRIRLHYLEAMEADDFSIMPSAVQGRGFLRLYAGFIGLDVETIFKEQRHTQVDEEVGVVGPTSVLGKPAIEKTVSVEVEKLDVKPLEKLKREGFWRRWLPRRTVEPATQITIANVEPVQDANVIVPIRSDAGSVGAEKKTQEVTTKGAEVEQPIVSEKPDEIPLDSIKPIQVKPETKAGTATTLKQPRVARKKKTESQEPPRDKLMPGPMASSIPDQPSQSDKQASPATATKQPRRQSKSHPKPQKSLVAGPVQELRSESAIASQAPLPTRPAPEPQPEVVVELPGARLAGLSLEAQPDITLEKEVKAREEVHVVVTQPGQHWWNRLMPLLKSHITGALSGVWVKMKYGSKPRPGERKAENPPLATLSSRAIFTEIGQHLRQRREALNMTLGEIEQHTRVRLHYLQCLEAGDYSQFPPPVQTRGLLSNYASFLDLDADALLLRYAEGLQVQRLERLPEQPAKSGIGRWVSKINIPILSSFVASDLLFGVGVVLLLVVLAFWGASRIIAARSQSVVEVTAPSISDILLASPVSTMGMLEATPSPLAGMFTPGEGMPATVEPTLSQNIHVQLNITAVERTWMRVVVDGKVKFEGRTVPDSAYPYEAEKQIEILTGNAAALRITYNQRDLGPMGNFGEVVDVIYTAKGILEPTAIPTATGTPTPRLSPTPTRTPTPMVTPSPAPPD